MTELTLELFLAIFVSIGAVGFGVVFAFLHKISDTVSKLSGTLDTFLRFVRQPDPNITESLKSHDPEGVNPYAPERKNELLDRWKDGLLTQVDAQELIGYLQEDAQNAAGALLAGILIAIGLLGALMLILSAGK